MIFPDTRGGKVSASMLIFCGVYTNSYIYIYIDVHVIFKQILRFLGVVSLSANGEMMETNQSSHHSPWTLAILICTKVAQRFSPAESGNAMLQAPLKKSHS